RQYLDDALEKCVEHELAKVDFQGAAATAEKIENPSRRATSLLRVATAHARAGDGKAAVKVAAGIQLVSADSFPGKERFDFQKPATWGVCYDWKGFGGMLSIHWSNQRAADAAGAAMTLAQTLGQQPAQSY